MDAAILLKPVERNPKEASILNILEKVSLLNSQEEAVTLVKRLNNKTESIILSFINAHAYNVAYSNSEFSSALLNSDILFRDGIGMQLLFKSIGKNPGADLNGTDLIPVLIDSFKGQKVALLGTKFPYLDAAARKLSYQGHNIVLTASGFHTFDHYIEYIQKTKPDLIILGMGMPKQEKLSIFLRNNLKSPALIINGGAIIDFLGNKISRAPLWVRRLKMEWAFRLLLEPKRLFFRYVVGNFVFLLRTKKLKNKYYS